MGKSLYIYSAKGNQQSFRKINQDMTLHEAIEKLLRQTTRPMTTSEIAAALNTSKWYEKKDKSAIDGFQIHGRAKNYPRLFTLDSSTVSLTGKTISASATRKRLVKGIPHELRPSTSDEDYVLDLCDKVLKQLALRQHKFDFLTGDPSRKGTTVKLPVDAYYGKLKLVVEFRERQHTESVTFFDKPNKIAVSGVHRGEQRKIYDERRREVIPKNGLRLAEISYADFKFDASKRIIKDEKNDIEVIKRLLHAFVGL
jgi:hypothetical protein